MEIIFNSTIALTQHTQIILRCSVKVGDLIYDSHYGQHGLVVEVSETGEFCTILYEDGMPDRGIRTNEAGIEVIT